MKQDADETQTAFGCCASQGISNDKEPAGYDPIRKQSLFANPASVEFLRFWK